MADQDFWQSILDYCSDSQSAIPPLESETRTSDLLDIAPLSEDLEDLNMVDDIFTSTELLGASDSITALCDSTDVTDNTPEWDVSKWSSIPIPIPATSFVSQVMKDFHRINLSPEDNTLTVGGKPNRRIVPEKLAFKSLPISPDDIPGKLYLCDEPYSGNIHADGRSKLEDDQLGWYSSSYISTEELPHNFVPSDPFGGGVAELEVEVPSSPLENASSDDKNKQLAMCSESGNLQDSHSSCPFVIARDVEGVGDSAISSDESVNASSGDHNIHPYMQFNFPPSRYSAAIASNGATIYDNDKSNNNLCYGIHSSWNRAANKTTTLVDQRGSHQRGSTDRITDITMNELSHYFNMPITQAAKELKVGLTVLKKRCREFGIPRWPHRKMKSLESLIHNIQELGKNNGGLSNARLRNAVQILEEQKKLMEEMPGIELAERTKRLRQACFKASYKKRRQMAIEAAASNPSSASNAVPLLHD